MMRNGEFIGKYDKYFFFIEIRVKFMCLIISLFYLVVKI